MTDDARRADGGDLEALKDRLILAMAPDVAFDGWSLAALRAAARTIDLPAEEAMALFPRGAADYVAGFSDWADRAMLARLADVDLASLKVRDRVAGGVRARLAVLEPYREAVRRGLGVLAQPAHGTLGPRLLYRTVDAIWHRAGDTATDYNFYTKRGLLAAVYAATTLYWLDDRSPNGEATDAFLNRRLNDVMAIPKCGAKLRESLSRLPNPLRAASLARRRWRGA